MSITQSLGEKIVLQMARAYRKARPQTISRLRGAALPGKTANGYLMQDNRLYKPLRAHQVWDQSAELRSMALDILSVSQ